MRFRIGINLGDVIVKQNRLYGDGVNIAARIEGLAEAGGICISRNVYDQVKNKLNFGYEYLGKHLMKNISESVQVYRIKMASKSETSDPIVKVSLPKKPSIAILPFTNMSGDTEQEYFSDGITEDLITDLSKISGLFVIARNSMFTYKGKPVKVDQVGRELAVMYVLEGSVRKAGDRVRITAQLVDAGTGGHLWAERYDRNLEDIFALQDEVTHKIVSTLAVKLTEDEQEQLERRYTDNLEAYDYFLRGLEELNRYTKESNNQARRLFQQAIDLDPQFAAAFGNMSLTHWLEWSFGWTQDFQCLELAMEQAQKAMVLDDSLPEAYRILGNLCLWKRQHDQAIALTEKAITLIPNYADAISQLGNILSFAGQPEESIELVKRAMRLNPMYPVIYLFNLGHAYMLAGRYEEAIEPFTRILHRNPNFHPAHIYLAITYSELGLAAQAQTEADLFIGKSFSMSWDDWRQRLPYKDEAVIEHYFDVMRKIGIKPW